MAKIDVTLAADIRAVLGASGTGKSHYTKKEIRRAKRLMVWDADDEYQDLPAVSVADLARFLHGKAGKSFKARVVPSLDPKIRKAQFDLFCRVIFEIGDMLVVVEELRFVTSPSWAPEGWALLTSRGRKRGIRIIGTSQRPASIDKDFLGNCSTIRVGRLQYHSDRIAVAQAIDRPVEDLSKLTGHEAILWVSP
jgi:hypothetical protein